MCLTKEECDSAMHETLKKIKDAGLEAWFVNTVMSLKKDFINDLAIGDEKETNSTIGSFALAMIATGMDIEAERSKPIR